MLLYIYFNLPRISDAEKFSHGDGEESLYEGEHGGEQQGEGHGEDGGQGHGLGDDRQRRHRPQQQHRAPAEHTLYSWRNNLRESF